MTPELMVPEKDETQAALLATPSAAAHDNPGRRNRAKEATGAPSPSPADITPPEDSPVMAMLDDLVDPPIPEPLKTALTPELPLEWANHPMLQGFLAALQQKLNTLWAGDLESQFARVSKEHFKQVDDCLQAVCDSVIKRIGQVSSELNEHASYQLANALSAGVALRHDPYTITIRMVKAGMPIELKIAQGDFDALGAELGHVLQTLTDAGFTAP